MAGRIRINSLGARLSIWVAAVMIIAFGAIFLAVYRDTSSNLRSNINRDVKAEARQLARAVTELPHADPAAVLMTARTYVSSQPYRQTSPLLFVLVPGAGIASNQPELFGSVRPDDNETVTQQDQENQLSRKLGVPSFGYSTKQLPDVGPVQIFEVRIRAGNHQAYAGAGEPFATMIQAQRGIKRSFVLAGSIALVLAVLASYLVGARVSAPLRRLAALARRVDAGDLEPRMEVRATHSVEIRVLTDALNHMLDRLADSFSAQRSFVADASHELRTPLTVMRGELELLAMTKHPSDEELRDFQRRVQAEIARVSRLVDDLLLLAQAERTDFLRVSPIELAQFIPELWDSVKLTADRDFQLGTVPDAVLLADPDRLAQAIRNLARNAIEHTSDGDGLVRLEVELGPSPSVTFRVLDDGPGIPPAERERIFERFHRSDPGRTRSAGGAGLGLAIVHAIAEAHNGTVGATESRNRGAQVELKLPTVVSVDDRTAVPSSQHALDR